MANERVTVCLLVSPSDGLAKALEEAMAPFDQNGPLNAVDGWTGEWDSWRIHGGDGESGLPVLAGHDDDPRLIRVLTNSDGSPRSFHPLRCDGGPRGILDFERDREPARRRASERWAEWNDIAERYPHAEPLSSFLRKSLADPIEYPIQRARADHAQQSALQAYTRAVPQHGSQGVWHELNDPVSIFSVPLDDYVHRESSMVIPTEALLTLDGRWIASESFGPATDQGSRSRYCNFADSYMENLGDEVTVVRVLFHS